ncbi:MAG: hypothetical protein NVS2B12_13260 [Ktedonobacteraceae bacterium]
MEEQSSIATVQFRVGSLERELENVKRQLSLYVPTRENELQLKVINETVNRIEKDLASLSRKFIIQELEDQKREATLQRNQANLQIKILWGAVSTIVGLITSVLVGYLTHFFH